MAVYNLNGINSVEDDHYSTRQTNKNFILSQNYPNPFNPITNIIFTIPTAANVRIDVYNNLGQRVRKILDQPMSEGRHKVEFNGENLPSGIYFYIIDVTGIQSWNGKFHAVKKMVLLK